MTTPITSENTQHSAEDVLPDYQKRYEDLVDIIYDLAEMNGMSANNPFVRFTIASGTEGIDEFLHYFGISTEMQADGSYIADFSDAGSII